MHNKFPKRENDSRGHRTDLSPVDEAADISKKEIQAAVSTQSEEIQPTSVSGVVVNCLKLNVRKEPKSNAEVVTLISALTEVVVDVNASNGDFYKVCTATGIEGFCVKKYIALKQ